MSSGMASEPSWRTKLDSDRDDARKQIDSTLATTPAVVIIVAIIVVAVIWAIVSTFIPGT